MKKRVCALRSQTAANPPPSVSAASEKDDHIRSSRPVSVWKQPLDRSFSASCWFSQSGVAYHRGGGFTHRVADTVRVSWG